MVLYRRELNAPRRILLIKEDVVVVVERGVSAKFTVVLVFEKKRFLFGPP